jgi:hypothetical protein
MFQVFAQAVVSITACAEGRWNRLMARQRLNIHVLKPGFKQGSSRGPQPSGNRLGKKMQFLVLIGIGQ